MTLGAGRDAFGFGRDMNGEVLRARVGEVDAGDLKFEDVRVAAVP